MKFTFMGKKYIWHIKPWEATLLAGLRFILELSFAMAFVWFFFLCLLGWEGAPLW